VLFREQPGADMTPLMQWEIKVHRNRSSDPPAEDKKGRGQGKKQLSDFFA